MLTHLVVRMNGETFFTAGLHNGTSANLCHAFFARVERISEFTFTWTDAAGFGVRVAAR